jgi:hypothetical protein
MRVIDKPFIVGEHQVGVYQAYTEVEPEFCATEPGTRVLPAQYFYEKRLFFHLKKRYEPGENKFFPKGGFEVRGEGGEIRCFELDQVIIHPEVLKYKKTLDKMARRAEKEAKKRGRKSGAGVPKVKSQPGTVRRGRPALSAEEKAARLSAQAEARVRSNGRKGRPKSTHIKPQTTPKTTGLKRGRPALTAEQKQQKIDAKAAVRVRSGGRKGRPKSRL